jgi:glycosyltransferase involved in cell wall biosynthesis
MRISLIISTFDQPLSLGKVLRGVLQQTRKPDEVFIADDGSGSETIALIQSFQREASFPVHHVWHPHEGFRKVILLNRSVAAATGDYLVFLDGDCVPHPKFLADHERLAEKGFWVQGRRSYVKEVHVKDFEPGVSSVVLWLVQRKMIGFGKALRWLFPVVFKNKKQRGIIGCNMAFWREDVMEVNGFDETFAGRGIGPDSELGSRLYNLGRPRKFVYGRALVFHLDHFVMPRENLEAKKARLEEILLSGKTRCEKGVNQYLAAGACSKSTSENRGSTSPTSPIERQ